MISFTLMGVALVGCHSEQAHDDSIPQVMTTRKQVYELTLEDLQEYPVWEYALDEEDKVGQDEATVRSIIPSGPLDPSSAMFIIRTRFTLADGTLHFGYLTTGGDQRDLGTMQPHVVTERGQVGFWMGAILDDVAPLYSRLGKSPEQTFPVTFESEVPFVGGPAKGLIPAFLHLEDFRTDRIKEIK